MTSVPVAQGGGAPAAMFKDISSLLQPALATYLASGHFSDLTLVAPSGKRLLCHQVVLSAVSKRFARILEQGKFGLPPSAWRWHCRTGSFAPVTSARSLQSAAMQPRKCSMQTQPLAWAFVHALQAS